MLTRQVLHLLADWQRLASPRPYCRPTWVEAPPSRESALSGLRMFIGWMTVIDVMGILSQLDPGCVLRVPAPPLGRRKESCCGQEGHE
jgi:hypothetical protein